MATKRVQVERLRPQTTQTVFNRPVDTFVQPAPVQAGGLQQLAKFLNDITPQVAGIVEAKEKTETELQLRQLEDMDYMNGEGGFETLDTLKQSGEFVPRNKTVAYAYNKGLGAAMGKEIFTKVTGDYYKGLQDKSIQVMTPEEFSAWTQERVAEYVGEYADYTGETGVMAGIKAQADRIGSTFALQQAQLSNQYAAEMMNESFNNQLDQALYGIDITYGPGLTQALQDFADQMHMTDTVFSGTEINKRIVGALSERLQNTQSVTEAVALAEAARDLKAGTGTLQGTGHWREADLDKIINDSLIRVDQLEQAGYARDNREKTKQTAWLTDQIITWVQTGNDVEDFVPNTDNPQLYNKLNAAEIAQLSKTLANQLDFSKAEPMTAERYTEFYNFFANKTPAEADVIVANILSRGDSRAFGKLSLDEMKSIHSISRNAAGRKYTVFEDPMYKELEKFVASQYEVWNVGYNQVVMASLNLDQQAVWEEAELFLEETWIAISKSPLLISSYLEGENLELAQKVSEQAGMRGGQLNVAAIFANPRLQNAVIDGVYQQVTRKVDPGRISKAAQDGDGVGGGSNITLDTGEVISVTVTEGED